MKDILFVVSNHNVIIHYTGSNGIVHKEIYCVCIHAAAAEGIAIAMNKATKNDSVFISDYVHI